MLVIVVGLAMILLGLAVSFLVRIRSDAEEVRIVTAEAQGRIMLHAALMYLQETARIGWGAETFGWTDVRDGSLGPRPARNGTSQTTSTGASGGGPVSGALDGTYATGAPSGYNIPVPTWWQASWPAYVAIPDETLSANFPAAAQRCWPCPGSVGRFPIAAPIQPPYATQMTFSYNPVTWPSTVPSYGQTNADNAWVTSSQRTNTQVSPSQPVYVDWPASWLNQIFDPTKGSLGMLDPQPVANVWEASPTYTGAPGQTPDFISGAIVQGSGVSGDWLHYVNDGVHAPTPVQEQVRDGSDNVCWFRIYRETQADHDNHGFPAYNKVALYDPNNPTLKNWSVFVITCGVGPTRGYRFWDEADIQTYETSCGYTVGSTVTRGQDLASNSPLFQGLGEATFKSMLATTQKSWWRVEWSALKGGAFVPEHYAWNGVSYSSGWTGFPGWNLSYGTAAVPIIRSTKWPRATTTPSMEGQWSNEGARYSAAKTYGGNFRWMQRLDHEPPNW